MDVHSICRSGLNSHENNCDRVDRSYCLAWLYFATGWLIADICVG